ncbi:DTW domain-containing protein [Pelagophyceae sp. CCMP2097]|nr:DTW domain-containing protein [Pelagophyceae sp. CCMP2097]
MARMSMVVGLLWRSGAWALRAERAARAHVRRGLRLAAAAAPDPAGGSESPSPSDESVRARARARLAGVESVRILSTLPPAVRRANAERAGLERAASRLDDATIVGAARHALICEGLKKRTSRRDAACCAACWMRAEACICAGLAPPVRAPAGVDVFVWAHHREWGRSSNTGCLLAAMVDGAQMLMKGLPADDDTLAALLADPETLTAVLWPVGDGVVSPEQLRGLAAEGRRTLVADEAPAAGAEDDGAAAEASPRAPLRIALLVVDGTWSGARRMVNALPKGVWRVGLSEEAIMRELPAGSQHSNMLSPLRKHNNRAEDRVCTAQAATAALRALGHADAACDSILAAVEYKIVVLTAIRVVRVRSDDVR